MSVGGNGIKLYMNWLWYWQFERLKWSQQTDVWRKHCANWLCFWCVANWPESCHFVSQHKQHQFPGILNYLLILWAWLPSNHESWCSILEYVALYERIVIRSIEGDTSFRWGLCHFSIRVRLCYEISQFMHEMLGDPHRFWAILMAYDGNQLWSVGRRFE